MGCARTFNIRKSWTNQYAHVLDTANGSAEASVKDYPATYCTTWSRGQQIKWNIRNKIHRIDRNLCYCNHCFLVLVVQYLARGTEYADKAAVTASQSEAMLAMAALSTEKNKLGVNLCKPSLPRLTDREQQVSLHRSAASIIKGVRSPQSTKVSTASGSAHKPKQNERAAGKQDCEALRFAEHAVFLPRLCHAET
jgi:hypothetical protein